MDTSVAMSCQLETVRKLGACPKSRTATPRAMKMPTSRRRNAAAASSCGEAADPGDHAATIPAAAAMIGSCVASSRDNSATSRPSRITSTRSLIPRISGNSDEIIRIVNP